MIDVTGLFRCLKTCMSVPVSVRGSGGGGGVVSVRGDSRTGTPVLTQVDDNLLPSPSGR